MDKNEEWNNFMHRVTEISGIVAGLASSDKEQAEKAQTLADRYLSDGSTRILDAEENIEMKVKDDRTVINEKACRAKEKPTNGNEMDQETFMRQVGRDADQRAQDKIVRTEKAQTFKTRAVRAFRRGDFELALSCYDKAIDQIKDSCLLYTNRALTHLKLKKYNKVLHDCEWALKCNESSFKAHLYRAAAHKHLGDLGAYAKCCTEMTALHPHHQQLADDFLAKECLSDDEDNEE